MPELADVGYFGRNRGHSRPHHEAVESTWLTDAVEKVGLYDSPPVVPIWAE